jgi:hypothetical protein
VQSPNSSLNEGHHRSQSSSSGTDEGGWGATLGKERDGTPPAESNGSPHSGSLDSGNGRESRSHDSGDVAPMSREDSGSGALWNVEGIKREVGNIRSINRQAFVPCACVCLCVRLFMCVYAGMHTCLCMPFLNAVYACRLRLS